MTIKLRNDATESIDGIVYQFYTALKYAFELPVNKSLYIEKYGDVTIDDKLQVEVKKYKGKLSSVHKNLWNTIYNWLDENFDVDVYETLILMTTQEISVSASINNWNDLKASRRLKILLEAKSKYESRKRNDENILKKMEEVLSQKNKVKLNKILEKFIIVYSSPSQEELFEQLCMKRAHHISDKYKKQYIKALLGYVISPKDKGVDKWEVTYDEFSNECETLSKLYYNESTLFPNLSKYDNFRIDDYKNHLFVKKIEDIDLEEEIEVAVSDYAKIHSVIIYEFSKRMVSKSRYKAYEEELKNDYSRLFRKAKRGIVKSNIISKSQDFYDDIMSMNASTFMTYNDTPKTFKNGILHILADEEEENVKWKLGDSCE